jgi:nucleoside-diphosphate-sugar epimerase
MISSKAVYIDNDGNHSNSDRPPRFHEPISESQPTLPPREDIPYDSREGYGVNKVAAERVLLDSGQPVSVLRPSKIHGRGARPAREWMWVKRALDGRTRIFLAHRGEGGDHTTAAVNIAALVETCARFPAARVLNSADPDASNGVTIARTIAKLFDLEWEETLLDGPPIGNIGRHPWDRYPPVVLDTSAAQVLGYSPVGTYAATVGGVVDWLVETASSPAGPTNPAVNDAFFEGLFDYAAEDRFVVQD